MPRSDSPTVRCNAVRAFATTSGELELELSWHNVEGDPLIVPIPPNRHVIVEVELGELVVRVVRVVPRAEDE